VCVCVCVCVYESVLQHCLFCWFLPKVPAFTVTVVDIPLHTLTPSCVLFWTFVIS
jgi:hypothetical protein